MAPPSVANMRSSPVSVRAFPDHALRMANDVQIVARVPAELAAAVGMLARRRGRSFAAELRRAMREYVDTAEMQTRPAVRGPGDVEDQPMPAAGHAEL